MPNLNAVSLSAEDAGVSEAKKEAMDKSACCRLVSDMGSGRLTEEGADDVAEGSDVSLRPPSLPSMSPSPSAWWETSSDSRPRSTAWR